MRLFQLALLAKEINELSDDGLISISNAPRTTVHLEERAFMEMFPAGWSDGEPFVSQIDGKAKKIRSIRIDGVEYRCIREVDNELGSA